MAQAKKIEVDQLQKALEEPIRRMAEEVARSISEAPDSDIIGGSEFQVRDAWDGYGPKCSSAAFSFDSIVVPGERPWAKSEYAAARREMLDYPRFIANRWHIGSGPTEAACKHIHRRLKQSGMRWDRPGTNAITNLAALKHNHQWNTYWSQAA